VEEAAGERPATATVRLQRSDTTVTVRCSDLVETNEARAARDAARAGAMDARGADVNGAQCTSWPALVIAPFMLRPNGSMH